MNHVRGPSARPRGTAPRRRGEAIDAGHEALNNVRLHAGSDASDPGRPAQCRVALVFEGGAVRVTITDTGAASTRTGQPGCATGSATPSWPGWRRSGQGVPGLAPRRGDAGRPGVERSPGQAGQARTRPGRARVHLLLGARRHLRLLAAPHSPVGRCDDRDRGGTRGRGRGAPGGRGAADAQRRHGRRTRRLRPGRVLARSARPQGTAMWPGAVPASSSTTTPFEFTAIVGPSVAATTTAVPA